MAYNIISGDSHVDIHFLPEDLFQRNAPPSLQSKMPRVVETDKGKWWKAGDTLLSPVGRFADTAGFSQEMLERNETMAETGLFDQSSGGYHPTTPELRIRDQELDGIDAEVIYGLFNVAPKLKHDPEAVTNIFKIYNDWIAEFTKSHPDRFAGLSCIPNFQPQAAAEEVERAAKLGLRGAEFGVSTAMKPIYHKDWDVLWSAVHHMGFPISFHIAGWKPRQVDPSEQADYQRMYATIATTMLQLEGVEFLASIIFSGACERFPNFKFVLGECGVSWLPYVLDRMDHEGEGQPGLTMKPSDYWCRQGFSTFQKEGVAGDMVPLIGENNIIWGSDYPHPDGVWPDSQETINGNFKNLKDQAAKRKIICDNAAKLYGFVN